MATPSRSGLITKLQKVLKKHYSAVVPEASRSVLEHVLFASCLENAQYAAAEEAFAALTHNFFDLNEVRVSTVRELSEVVAGLPDSSAAAGRVKRILQSVFEATYSFDLEELRKLNLGPAVERLEKIEGTDKFSVAYVVQAALGGHSIPIDAGTLGALRVVDLVTDQEVASGAVSGLERTIPKNLGVEFGSQLHQLGADFTANPYAPALHAILLEIDPGAKPRLPNRRAAKRAEQEAHAAHAAARAAEKAKRSPPPPVASKPAKETPKGKGKETAKAPPVAEAKKKGAAEVKPAVEAKKKPGDARTAAKEVEAEATRKKEKAVEEKPAVKKKMDVSKAKAPLKKKLQAAKSKEVATRSASEGLAKRKPR
jgi:hypothetical protein